VVVVPDNCASPLGKYEKVQWREVMQHIGKRLSNINPSFKTRLFTDTDLRVNTSSPPLLY